MKISIIGVGQVGSTLAYTLIMRGLGDELVLVDKNDQVAVGEALDLQHAEAFTSHPTFIHAGDISDTTGSNIIVITCSAPWNSDYTSRFDLGSDNRKLFEKIVPQLAQHSPEAIMLIISNPVEVMTYHAIQLSGFGPNRVFGTGTLIDSARFRTILSEKMKIHPDDLRAYILGEHGETQFPHFSMAMVGGSHIASSQTTKEAFHQTTRAGWDVTNRKGHTNYAISMAAALVIEAIVWDTHRTMPLSVLIDGFLGIHDVCLSLPVVVGKDGISQILRPELGPEEAQAFRQCAEVIRGGIERSIQN